VTPSTSPSPRAALTVDLDLRLDDPALRTAVLGAPWLDAAGLDARPDAADADAVLLVTDRALTPDEEQGLLARAATTPLVLAGPTLDRLAAGSALAEAAGLLAAGLSPAHEMRLRAAASVDPRGQGDVLVRDRAVLVDKATGDVEVGVTCDLALTTYPVATWRAATGVGALTVGSGPQPWGDRDFLRLVHRWLRTVLGRAEGPAVRVAMLGYGAIGHEHSKAAQHMPGLVFAGVCDSNPARVAAAHDLAPDVRAYADGAALVAADNIDLVVVSTPPDSHHRWARQALEAGKHVVLEKPMALSSAECDDLLALAAAQDRTLLVYQNRRWDPDYLALRAAVTAGRIGDVFHLETFVGGYGHPCNYWHSDAGVSGGAIFDWGSHVLDQVLDLVPGPIEYVTAANHKRRWHDVTNADHSRVTLRMADGVEAEFVYSDLAAALKPKWYVLGTEGAVVGRWRTERVVARNAIGTLDEDVLAPADSPADLFLHAPDGSVTAMAVPPAPPYAFHRELADALLAGLPTTVTAEGSRRVVAVMEAAERSALDDGRPVVPR